MTNLTSNTRQPLGVREGRGKAKGGWLKQPKSWGSRWGMEAFSFFFVWCVLVVDDFCFFLNSGWCFRDKPSTASSRSALLETTGTGSRTQGKSLSNKLLRINCCLIPVDESFFLIFKLKCFTISGLQLNLLCVCFILDKLRFFPTQGCLVNSFASEKIV